MSDQKFLNKVKDFSQRLDHKYDIEKFKLNESYSDSLLITTKISGSSGGDCYGGHTSDYDVGDNEIISDLSSSISYILMEYFSEYIMVECLIVTQEYLSNLNHYDYIAHDTDYSDYYGNHSKEGLYQFPIFPLVKLMLDEEHFQIFKSYLSNQKSKIEKVFIDRKTAQQIVDIKQKLESFEIDKAKELKDLQENVKRYENMLISLKKHSENFTVKKIDELNSLKKQLLILES